MDHYSYQWHYPVLNMDGGAVLRTSHENTWAASHPHHSRMHIAPLQLRTQRNLACSSTKHAVKFYIAAPQAMASLCEFGQSEYCLDLHCWAEQQIRHTDPTDTVHATVTSHWSLNIPCSSSDHQQIVLSSSAQHAIRKGWVGGITKTRSEHFKCNCLSLPSAVCGRAG